MFSKELLVILVSALPISELRGGIPLALYYNFSPLKAFLLAVLGNGIIILPLLMLVGVIFKYLKKIKIFAKFSDWFEKHTLKKKDIVNKYGLLGLMLFVAIPLPYTGAYTACFLSHLLGLKIKNAFLFIFLGVLVAGILVLLASLGVLKIFSI